MANKDPAFLFYPSDYIVGTIGMNYEQKGKYVELLCLQHSKGGYLKERDVKRILSFDNEDDMEILEKFKKDKNGYFNNRLLKEITKRQAHSEKQRKKIQDYWDKKKKEDTTVIPQYNNGKTMVVPLENENEDEDINENKDIIINSIKDLNNKIDFTALANYWNLAVKDTNISKVRLPFNKTRQKHINARVKESSLETVYEMIDKVIKSDFLLGNKLDWNATFSWCINPENYAKILEGNYDNKQNGKNKSSNDFNDRVKNAEKVMGKNDN